MTKTQKESQSKSDPGAEREKEVQINPSAARKKGKMRREGAQNDCTVARKVGQGCLSDNES